MSPRRHPGIVTTLLVLATLAGILASFAVWSARQLLETEQWEQTSSELLENEEIRVALGTFLVDELFENADIQAEIAGALPPRLAPLAGPASGAIRQLAEERAPIFLARPRVQALWEEINRAAHERFVAVVEGDAPALSEAGDEVYLDLGVIVQQLGTELGISAAAKIPAGVAQLEVMSADDLDLVKDAVKLLEGAAYILFALTMLLLALAVWLAQGWRRSAVRNCGFVFIVIGAVVLVAQSVAGTYVVDALVATAAAEPAADATWSIATSLLNDLGVAMIGYGIVIVLGAWLAGPGALGSAARRAITPFLRDRRILYPILLAVVLLVFVWSPTEGTRRLLPSLLLILLLVGGAEALRRQAMREFPDATLGAFSERWRERMASLRMRGRSPTAEPESSGQDRISQLERLSELHRTGVLDDAELQREKELIGR